MVFEIAAVCGLYSILWHVPSMNHPKIMENIRRENLRICGWRAAQPTQVMRRSPVTNILSPRIAASCSC